MTCAAHVLYAESMPKMIQIRNVPDDVHRIVKARAAKAGMSLSDYLKREIEQHAKRPTLDEWLDRVAKGKPIPMSKSSAQIIREMRDSR